MGKVTARKEADYYRDSKKLLKQMQGYIAEHFGEPCRDMDPSCLCCEMWGLYGTMKRLIDVPDEVDEKIAAEAVKKMLRTRSHTGDEKQ